MHEMTHDYSTEKGVALVTLTQVLTARGSYSRNYNSVDLPPKPENGNDCAIKFAFLQTLSLDFHKTFVPPA